MNRFPHDTTLDGPDDPREPHPEPDPDDEMERRQERARMDRMFGEDDWDDGYEPAPRRRICIDHTGSRFRNTF